jgi:hypothetical protein
VTIPPEWHGRGAEVLASPRFVDRYREHVWTIGLALLYATNGKSF